MRLLPNCWYTLQIASANIDIGLRDPAVATDCCSLGYYTFTIMGQHRTRHDLHQAAGISSENGLSGSTRSPRRAIAIA